MKFRIFALILCFLAGVVQAWAQRGGGKYSYNDTRHEFRIAYSDGLTLSSASFWGMGIGSILMNSSQMEETSTGVFGIGYRFGLNRLRVGLDLGIAKVSGKEVFPGEKTPNIKHTELDFLIMPALEVIYYKKGIMELYGSAAVGMDVCRRKSKALNEAGKKRIYDPYTDINLAYQLNPIALHVGNDHIGGFIEAGIGYKGFLTAGVSMKI